MAMTFRHTSFEGVVDQKKQAFDVEGELRKHSWHPNVTALDAEEILSGKPAFTYLIRQCDYDRGFMVSFVNERGDVAHDHFSLIDSTIGIWRNMWIEHTGKLGKVLRDMMGCGPLEGTPLDQ